MSGMSSNIMSSSLVVDVPTRSQLTDCTDWSVVMAKCVRSVSMPLGSCCSLTWMPAMSWLGIRSGGSAGTFGTHEMPSGNGNL